MSYSQQDEEQHILEFFGENAGRLIDIGAYDGKCFSNTLALIERGWRGVMVEPEPMSFLALMRNTADHADRLTYVNAAISTQAGLTKFWDSSGDAVSSLDPAHVEKWTPTVKAGMHPFYINPVAPRDFFPLFEPADFINLDVEGTNWEIFRELPFDWPELRMICVEYDDRDVQMLSLAEEHGFRQLHKTAQNLILVR